MRTAAIAFALVTSISTLAAEDRVVLTELFTATWCATCPYADVALDSLALEMGEDSLAVLQYHVSDSLATSETTARADWYLDPIRLPNALFDGTTSVHEVSSVPDAYSKYRQKIEERLQVPSPLMIEGSVTADDTSGQVSAKIRVLEAFSDEALRFYGVLYENELDEFNYVVRDILPTEELAISTPGDSAEVTMAFSLDPLWDHEKMGMVVFVQSDSTRQVLQSTRIEHLATGVVGDLRSELEDQISFGARPNPFSSSVRFSFSAALRPETEMVIYDSSGRTVRTLPANLSGSSGYSLLWDGCDAAGTRIATGIYYVRVVDPRGTLVRKVVCIR
jgi:hypothetical protein